MSHKKLLVFSGWYPSPEQPLQFPFVAQQVKIMQEYLPKLTGETWKIVVWNQVQAIDIPNLLFRGKVPKNYDWLDEKVLVLHRQSKILSHRIKKDQSYLMFPQMRLTYEAVINHLGGVPDCVWTVTLSSAILWNKFQKEELFKIPSFLQEHSVPLTMHLKSPRAVKDAQELSLRSPEVTVVAERQIEEFKDVSPHFKCQVIWNAVDPIFLKEGKEKNKLEKNTLLFVGRLSYQKGVDRLLNAFSIALKIRANLKLKIVGYGEEEDNMRSLAKDLKIHNEVQFLGSKKPAEINELLETADIFVLPSRYENCPVSLLEAQVKGVPCLVTENGASEKVLLPRNGLTIKDDGGGKQLADGMIAIYDDLHQFNRTQIREKALKAFAPEVFARKMYRSMIR